MPLGTNRLKKCSPCLPEAVDQDRQEDRQRQRRGDDDVGGDGEGIGNEADDVHRQDEHEQREHEGEEAHAFGAGRTSYCIGDEFVGQFGRRLHAARHQTALGGAADQEYGDDHHGGDHVGRRIGEGDLGIADLGDRKQIDDLELMDWIDSHEH